MLHRSWKAVLERLSSKAFVPLDKLSPLIRSAPFDAVEWFLDELFRKGFLEQEGFSTLSDHPFVSIIIPVRNRPREIEAALRSLDDVVYPPEKLEIIVVDDASTDHTPKTVSAFPVHLIALKQNKQASYCRNLAAQKARGDILAFIDSDCQARPLWLLELIPAFKDPSLGAVGGKVDSYFQKTSLDRYEQVKSSLIIGFRAKRSLKRERFFYVPSCNLLVRRDLFLQSGGFKEALSVGEDVDLCWRLQDAGHPVEFRPAGRVYHRHRNRLRQFCARRFDYGTSEPLLQKLHPGRHKEMLFPPGGSLFWGMAILAATFASFLFLAFCGIIVLLDTLGRLYSIAGKGANIKFQAVFMAVLRSYSAFFYHCCAFVSRYYLFWAIVIAPLFPYATIMMMGMHLLAGLVEYFLKEPRLDPVSFLFYFSLEQLSYQLGVWWGCVKHHSFRAVNPTVVWRISPETQ
ncbi:MAG: mycofactocin biosynthesis glycosyltransferase MftF [Deltaproteobacteria bacterium]|nr:mycofactocin biosynthesis glycosyltransferase MftF [Deltaproteobacteria bacterium]